MVDKEYLESLVLSNNIELELSKANSYEEYKTIIAKFAQGREEKWVIKARTLKGGDKPVCPMCYDLDQLGWLPLGTLPPNRKAHSVLGKGNWNAPDSSCQCSKVYRFTSNPQEPLALAWDGAQWIAYKEKINKVRIILEKYKGVCTC